MRALSEVLAALEERLARVLDDLTLTSEGRLVTEAAADEVLGRLRVELVSRMMAEVEPWKRMKISRRLWSSALPGSSLPRHELASSRESSSKVELGNAERRER